MSLRNSDRDFVREETGSDRWHILCGRKQEIRVFDPELPAASKRRDADALLRQSRAGFPERHGCVLWSVGYGQNDAVG